MFSDFKIAILESILFKNFYSILSQDNVFIDFIFQNIKFL